MSEWWCMKESGVKRRFDEGGSARAGRFATSEGPLNFRISSHINIKHH